MAPQLSISALYAPQLQHLTVWYVDELSDLAPYLGALKQLRTLNISNNTCAPNTVTNWPAPSFSLQKLVACAWMRSPGDEYPGLAELNWLIDSSRASLRHIELGGFHPAVLDDILRWGDRLETVHLGMGYWDGDELARAVDRLARMKALQRLQLCIGPDEADDEIDVERYHEVVATVREAVRQINEELGREVCVVVL